jgi:hypothetical protein
VFSPKKYDSTVVAALPMIEWAEGYSGCAGVTIEKASGRRLFEPRD